MPLSEPWKLSVGPVLHLFFLKVTLFIHPEDTTSHLVCLWLLCSPAALTEGEESMFQLSHIISGTRTSDLFPLYHQAAAVISCLMHSQMYCRLRFSSLSGRKYSKKQFSMFNLKQAAEGPVFRSVRVQRLKVL